MRQGASLRIMVNEVVPQYADVFTRGIRVSEDDLGKSKASELTRIELLDNGIRICRSRQVRRHRKRQARYLLACIQGSATGLPLTNTTTVGFPVALTACTSFN